MIVSKDNFYDVVTVLSKASTYGLDTETTGLSILDRPFSLQICNGVQTYYFNFNDVEDHNGQVIPENLILPPENWELLKPIFENPESTWLIHNAVFDLRMLGYVGIEIMGHIHCTMGTAKLIDNSLMRYSLDACLQRIGLAKDDAVKEYVKKNKLYTMVTVPGKKVRKKLLHYHKVPFQLMVDYGISDAEDVSELGLWQMNSLPPNPYPEREDIYIQECDLIPAVHAMSARGLRVDTDYTHKCVRELAQDIELLKEKISEMAGEPYKSGPLWLKDAFVKNDLPYEVSSKTGNPTFVKEKIETLDHPLVDSILQLRHQEKFYGTYFHSFLYYSDNNGILYSTANPSGTDTGRFTYQDPNLQNIPKVSTGPDPRRCFIPREGYNFLMVDYKQQEYRLMLDYAGDTDLIAKVNEGMDVHTATADLLGVDRGTAKTLNFMLLYGGGAEKLAHGLGVSVAQGKYYKDLYFRRLPKVARFIRTVIKKGKMSGQVYNWAGRVLKPKHIDHAYKLPNYLIQSSGADVIKKAIIEIHELLEGYQSNLLLTVHDELIFEIAHGEEDLIQNIVYIMESIYAPFNGVRLECDASISNISWSENDKRDYTF